MPRIETVPLDKAEGLLKRLYDAAVQRAGKVFNILKLMSLRPRIAQSSMQFYSAIMHAESPLSRGQREMIATVVSRVNNCFYWTEAHAEDLRAEVQDDGLVAAVKDDYRTAELDPAMRELLDVCVLSTRKPWAVTAEHIKNLRVAGFCDEAIHDAFQVVGYFNYINRIADGLGVELEPEMPDMPADWERE